MDLGKKYTQPLIKSDARNSRESLVEEIVAATLEKDKPKLTKLLSMTANSQNWTDTFLHQLYQKRLDPKIRNYTAFVKSHIKIVRRKK